VQIGAQKITIIVSAFISNPASGLQLMLPNGIHIGIGAEVNPVLLQTGFFQSNPLIKEWLPLDYSRQ
jgi:hypothetical protein